LEHLVVEVSDLTGGASVWNGPVSAAGEFEVSGVSPGAYDIMVTGTAGAVVADQVVYLNSPFETIEIPLTNASSERPATGTISITELNHKVPGKAHREALLALKAWKNNDNENCIEHLQMAIAIDPEYLEARRNLGLVYLRLNQPEKVISAYEEVLRIDSRSADAYSYISVAQAQLNHVSEAEDAARRSLAIEAVNRRSRYMLGLLLAEQKKTTPRRFGT
jgi:tetratricopeptide (TPR) repeat protein